MRVVVWFSCGAASAAAARLAIEKHGHERTHLVYCDTSASEHPDNHRFRRDVEKWLDHEVDVIRSEKYASIDEVFEETRYMAGIQGARCTVEMKKVPRFNYQEPDDIHVFGLTVEEPERIKRLVEGNPELHFDWILRDQGKRKRACFRMLEDAGIKRPALYGLGFPNNNCIGCVKATSIEYWRRVREHFPEVFSRRAAQSRALGVRLTRLNGERIFLDEIPDDQPLLPIFENVSCGPECAEG